MLDPSNPALDSRLPRMLAAAGSALSRSAVFIAECLIRGYQVALSPLLIGNCKFCPSCSEYCIHAIREWGVIRGARLGMRRLLRCHPFSPGGIDPVPRRSV